MEAWYAHIHGSLHGQLDAQRALYEALAPRVLHTCKRYFADEADAEDAMIRTMTTMFQQLPTIREPKALPAWLRRTAVNECLMELRKRRTERLDEADLPEAGATAVCSIFMRSRATAMPRSPSSSASARPRASPN
ncbi:MAG: sigma-70 family RNA polymerase sigma factor [Cryomorphaceae bacterium]|nr:sigma-70 family RNA polymerase sigma factor [Cryomorphaceae bacterium]